MPGDIAAGALEGYGALVSAAAEACRIACEPVVGPVLVQGARHRGRLRRARARAGRHVTRACACMCARREGIEPGPRMDGHFRGWVEEKTRVALGIAPDPSSAWNNNGGGKFTFKPTGGESAKDHARKMLHKNPNSYFYR